ncbi:MAG: tetratricopeptide repeat protein, partial [Planctomycetaceae bacterium]|jgi:tetratricopeptide (TPR) repeat protein|nr:tetratricopeptide repeat protein [Planctomycetaceae bacterium]
LFSNPAFVKEASKRYGIILDELEDAKAHLRQAKRTAMAQPFMVGLEAYVERLKYVVKMWESTPFGRKALQQAEERAEKFIEKNKYGLYRGEVLLDIGTAHLVSFFDVDNGEKWLNRAAEWFDNVQQFDKDLKDFELPESVRKVSQPPKEERQTDFWNNTRYSKPQAGSFFNRRTCNWYLASKRKDIVLKLGLLAYAQKDYEKAKKLWESLYEIDPYFTESAKTISGATPSRLLWNIKNNCGALYATVDQMKCFIDEQTRFKVLLADLELENLNFLEAEKKFRQLIDNREIRLNQEQTAYCVFGLAISLMGQLKTKEAISLLENFKPNRAFSKTITAPRALLNLAICYTTKLETQNYSYLCYEYLIKTFPNTKEAETALFNIAETYFYEENYNKALSYFNEYFKHYPQGGYASIIKDYISEINLSKQQTLNH